MLHLVRDAELWTLQFNVTRLVHEGSVQCSYTQYTVIYSPISVILQNTRVHLLCAASGGLRFGYGSVHYCASHPKLAVDIQ